MKKTITIAIPCHNEESNVEITYKKINAILKQIPRYTFRFLFTDNGSTDTTRKKILSLVQKDARVRGIFLSRNFGFEASLAALLDNATGNAVILLLCDLQDPPELISQFIKKWEEGYTIVAGKYKNTEDDIITAFLRRTFYFILKKISDLDIPINASEVALLDRRALDAVKSLPERYRFFRGLRVWIGFKVTFISYHRRKRLYGESTYTLGSYFKYAERGIYGFSYLVLDILMYATMVLTGISLICIIAFMLYHAVTVRPYDTTQTVLLAMFFFGSVQLFGIGILGKYIQVIVEETKNRPVYIIDEIVGAVK